MKKKFKILLTILVPVLSILYIGCAIAGALLLKNGNMIGWAFIGIIIAVAIGFLIFAIVEIIKIIWEE